MLRLLGANPSLWSPTATRDSYSVPAPRPAELVRPCSETFGPRLPQIRRRRTLRARHGLGRARLPVRTILFNEGQATTAERPWPCARSPGSRDHDGRPVERASRRVHRGRARRSSRAEAPLSDTPGPTIAARSRRCARSLATDLAVPMPFLLRCSRRRAACSTSASRRAPTRTLHRRRPGSQRRGARRPHHLERLRHRPVPAVPHIRRAREEVESGWPTPRVNVGRAVRELRASSTTSWSGKDERGRAPMIASRRSAGPLGRAVIPRPTRSNLRRVTTARVRRRRSRSRRARRCFIGSSVAFSPHAVHHSATSYTNFPIVRALLRLPSAVRRYNGGGGNSYHYQVQVAEAAVAFCRVGPTPKGVGDGDSHLRKQFPLRRKPFRSTARCVYKGPDCGFSAR